MKPKISLYFSEQNKINKILLLHPHRSKKKDVLKIENKTVPLHFISLNRSYQGNFHQLGCFQKWAQIPTNPSKQVNESSQLKQKQKSQSASILNKAKSSTSEIFLKRYLKRKQRIVSRDYLNLSQSGSRHQDKKINRITSDNYYLDDYIELNKETNISQSKIHLITHYNGNNKMVTEQSSIFNRYTFKEQSKLNLTTKKYKIAKHFFKNTLQISTDGYDSQKNS